MLYLRILLVLAVAPWATAASNDTVYPYQIDESIRDNKDFDTVIIEGLVFSNQKKFEADLTGYLLGAKNSPIFKIGLCLVAFDPCAAKSSTGRGLY